MNKVIDLKEVSSNKLREGYYRELFPEFYELKKAVENNPWHINQNVFDHVVAVFAGLEQVQVLAFLDDATKKRVSEHLQGKIGNLTRKEILIASTMLHDIAKVDCVVTSADGTARSPGHEIIGAYRVKNFSQRFGFGKQDEEYVKRIITYHGFTNDILTLSLASGNMKKYSSLFREIASDVYIELGLLMYADILGSNLATSNNEEYHKRLTTVKELLELA